MDFYDKMHIVCMAIPAGCVATYGQIAMLCGAPSYSRQVGFGLRNRLAGDKVPAHRIVNSRGELSGAHSFEFADLQKTLLQEEAVEVFWTGKCWRVDLRRFGWKNTLEEALNFETMFDHHA